MSQGTKRQNLSKKIRFEVFKRDKFTCQYCGRMAPDVILEVDHIRPVIDGGNNNILNLVTSCRDCNRGKGKTRLSDDCEIKKQQKQLIDMADKKEQLEMLIDWKDELLAVTDRQIDSICNLIEKLTHMKVDHNQRNMLYKQLKQFSYTEVYEAAEISILKYCDNSMEMFDRKRDLAFAIRKIGGICYNRKNGRVNKDGDL